MNFNNLKEYCPRVQLNLYTRGNSVGPSKFKCCIERELYCIKLFEMHQALAWIHEANSFFLFSYLIDSTISTVIQDGSKNYIFI